MALMATALGLSLAACSKSDDKSQASVTPANVTLTADQLRHVRLFTVAPSQFHKTVEATGIVDFDNDQATSVLAPFSGPVARILVQPGQHVRKGEALAEVDSPDFAAAVGAYRAAIITAQTDRHLADMDKDLLAHQGVAQREAAQAQTDAVTAETTRDAARQALVALGADPRTIGGGRRGRGASRLEGIIRAPIAGTVAERLISPGQLLQAGTTPCFTVADLSRVWVMAQIYGSDLASVNAGDTAQIDTGLGLDTISGRIDNVATEVNPDTHAVMARVVVDNPGAALKKQMYVRVEIKSHRMHGGTLVPVSAILRDDENLPFVYVAQRDGSFARQHVTLGTRSGDRYDIPEGLKPGDRVVADGAIFIQFMQSQ
jgi:cobalt-zinc-cadmium efflux system membrane fusion protein